MRSKRNRKTDLFFITAFIALIVLAIFYASTTQTGFVTRNSGVGTGKTQQDEYYDVGNVSVSDGEVSQVEIIYEIEK